MAERKPTSEKQQKPPAKPVLKDSLILDGRRYEAGEAIPSGLTDEQRERLKRIGVI